MESSAYGQYLLRCSSTRPETMRCVPPQHSRGARSSSPTCIATAAASSSRPTTRTSTARAASRAVFVQDNHSRSRGGTLRGLHLQRRRAPGQAVRVHRGRNLRRRRRRPARLADVRPLGRRRAVGGELPAVLRPGGLRARFLRAERVRPRSSTSAATSTTRPPRSGSPGTIPRWPSSGRSATRSCPIATDATRRWPSSADMLPGYPTDL